MKYTIKQMATLLGTTTHKLRYYQKMGIIKPVIEESTGYRFYSVLDTRRFNLACCYCNLGFSIQDSLQLLSYEPVNAVIEELDNQKERIKKEITFKKLCLCKIDDLKFHLDNLQNTFNNVVETEMAEMIRIEFSAEEIINKDLEILSLRDELLKYSPLIEWTSRIKNSSVINKNNPMQYYYGINMKTEYAEKLGIDISKYTIIPKGTYLYTTFLKKDRSPFDYDTLAILQNYLHENNLNVTADGYSSCFHSTINKDDYNNYHYIIVKK